MQHPEADVPKMSGCLCHWPVHKLRGQLFEQEPSEVTEHTAVCEVLASPSGSVPGSGGLVRCPPSNHARRELSLEPQAKVNKMLMGSEG